MFWAAAVTIVIVYFASVNFDEHLYFYVWVLGPVEIPAYIVPSLFSPADASPFPGRETYPPLNHSVESLRILRLLPGSRGLSCQTESTSFRDHPQYRALSYEWGSGDRTLPIVINGIETRVGKNLWEALYYLRDAREEQVLWVDAICINQHDLAEKAIVVPRMNFVYRRAAEVIIWLGPHPPPKLVNLSRMAWWAFAPPNIDKAYHKEWWHQAVPWLFDLMHANYWTRTWIIQEVGEAVRLTVHFGKQSLPWDAFVAAVATYRKCFPRASWTDKVSALDDLRRSRREGEIYSFTHLISVFRDSFCKVPHDKIYAFLGMAADDSPDLIPAAYNKTVAQVYGDVMRFVAESTIDRAVKEIEQVHMSALVRRLLTRSTSKTLAVDGKPTSILRQAEPYTYYENVADKDGKLQLRARTAYRKQWYEWAYTRHEQTTTSWLPTAPERLDSWIDFSQRAPQTHLMTAKGIIVGEIESFGPTVESFLTSSVVSKAWKMAIIQKLAGNSNQKNMIALYERLHVVVGQQAAASSALDWITPLRPNVESATASTTDPPRLFIGSTGFFGIASPGARMGDRVVQFWGSSAAAIVRRDENRSADDRAGDGVVARGSIVKEGYSHDWDIPQDKGKFAIEHEGFTIRLHLDVNTLTAMTLNSLDM
ncbi:MAG: hypothetical protein Q9207_003833 [Kuettlingeria erythrocarpa]